MPDLTYKTLDTQLKADPGERSVIARISTIDVDRVGDVMLPSGLMDSDYLKNPVVLMQHRADLPPIGRATAIVRGSKAIKAKVHFPARPEVIRSTDAWPPDEALGYFQAGLLNAFSVGFTIEDARPATQKDIDRFGEGARQIITRWNLHEFSAVSVPANQNALAEAVSKSRTWLRECWNIADQPKRSLVCGRLLVVR